MKRAASAGAAAVTAPTILGAQADAGQGAATSPPAAEPPAVEVLTGGRSGSDFMVDVIKSLGVPYVCGNPGSSFRGLQESIVNYGGNRAARVPDLPPRRVVGGDGARLRQDRRQAARSCSRTGPSGCSTRRWRSTTRGAIACPSTSSSATRSTRSCGTRASNGCTACRMPRRWCATTSSGTTRRYSLQHFAESAVRAYKVSMTPWAGPVVLVADAELQERPIRRQHGAETAHPEADARLAAAGRLRRRRRARAAPGGRRQPRARSPIAPPARRPAWSARRARRARCRRRSSARCRTRCRRSVPGRMNFPSRHPLNQTLRARPPSPRATSSSASRSPISSAPPTRIAIRFERSSRPATKTGAKLVTITAGELSSKANYQDFQRYSEVDLALAGDAEATLPSLIEAVKRLLTDDRKRAFAAARRQAGRGEPRGQRARARRCDLRLGRGRRSARRVWRRKCGRRFRRKTGRSSTAR